MKISKNSWHYWLVREIGEFYDPSNSLCVYFWQVVWSIFKTMVIACFVLLLALLLSFPLWQFFVTLPLGAENSLALFNAIVYSAILIGFLCSWLVDLIEYCQEKRQEKLYKKLRQSEPVKPKQPSLLTAYIQAKKEKFCPTIQFTDE